MQDVVDVNPRAVIDEISMVRCGYGSNIELFQYESPDQAKTLPKKTMTLGLVMFTMSTTTCEGGVTGGLLHPLITTNARSGPRTSFALPLGAVAASGGSGLWKPSWCPLGALGSRTVGKN